MPRFLSFFLLFLALYAGAWTLPAQAAPESFVPEAYPVERYKPVWQKSPFTLSTATEDGPVAGWAEDLTLIGVSADGKKSYIWVLDKKTQVSRMISQEAEEGFVLESVVLDDDLAKVSAVIRKDGETAELKYAPDLLQDTLSAPAQAGIPQSPVPQPPVRNANNPRTAPGPNRNVPRRVIIPSRNR